ncbi:MAG: DUF3488 domain-containing protein [Deltaproteobacteria bacterium]|nr:DUF3488 domain-containing protein [Deltaproteobacteria bacterium]
MTLPGLRKGASSLAVAFAFGAVAHTGELPVVAIALFGAAWLASLLWGERIGKGRSRLLTLATVSVLGLLLGGWFAGLYDFVVGAALFAASVTASRLLARQGPVDDGPLYLSALMMVAAGAALASDLLYGLFFAGFTVAISFALALTHLERVAVESQSSPSAVRRLISARLMGAVGVLAMLALCGAIVVFFAFPRFTTGFLSPLLGHRRSTAGFSTTLRLGGRGMIKDDPRVVAHVVVSPDPGVAALDLRWKGKSFDRFDGKVWSSSANPRSSSVQRLRIGGSALPSDWTAQVTILPEGGSPVVFVPEGTREVSYPRRVPARQLVTSLLLEQDSAGDLTLQPVPEAGYSYALRVGPAAVARSAKGAEYPTEIRERYLSVPEGLDPRIPALARRWTEGLTDPFDKARAIERALLTGYSYTLDLDGGEGDADPLAHFLFERRQGHCEYFASALTVLLRSAGVPARNAVGYYGGQRSEPGRYVLRAGDAHAWTEAFFPETGFVAFDATPAAARPSSASSWHQRWADLVDRARSARLRLVIDYSFREQVAGVSGEAQAVSRLLARLHGGSTPPIRRLLGALGVLALSLVVARRLWRSAGPRRRARGGAVVPLESREAVRLYRALLRKLRRRGIDKRPGQTARELVGELRRASRPESALAEEIAERYLAARFGGRPLLAEERARLKRELRRM